VPARPATDSPTDQHPAITTTDGFSGRSS
jgi:hypothetical protein